MLKALTVLLVCQFLGEIITNAAELPLPGPVLGLLLLLALLAATGGPQREMRMTAQTLLLYLPLLFVPAGVGVITQLDVLGRNWLPVTVAIVVSTVLGLLVTAWLMQKLSDDEP